MSNNFSIALLALASVLALPHAQALSGDNDNLEHTKDSLEKVKELVVHKKAILVDVRDLVEWNAGHVDGAVFLPWRDLQDKFDEKKLREKLPKDTIIYTYCAVG